MTLNNVENILPIQGYDNCRKNEGTSTYLIQCELSLVTQRELLVFGRIGRFSMGREPRFQDTSCLFGQVTSSLPVERTVVYAKCRLESVVVRLALLVICILVSGMRRARIRSARIVGFWVRSSIIWMIVRRLVRVRVVACSWIIWHTVVQGCLRIRDRWLRHSWRLGVVVRYVSLGYG